MICRNIKMYVCIYLVSEALIVTLGCAVGGIHRAAGIPHCFAMGGTGSCVPGIILRAQVRLPTSHAQGT